MPHALQFLVFTLAGWLSRQQQDLIDYLREENRILREQLGGQRLRLNDEQRRRLAVRGNLLGRKALGEVVGIATPDTMPVGESFLALCRLRVIVDSPSCPWLVPPSPLSRPTPFVRQRGVVALMLWSAETRCAGD